MHTDTAVCGNICGNPHHEPCRTLCLNLLVKLSKLGFVSQFCCDEGPKAEHGLLQGQTPLHYAAPA